MKAILKKLHAIMSEVDFIEKDKKNDHFKYTYASEYAIKTALHEKLVAHGVLFTLSATDVKKDDQITTVNFHYRFIDIESAEELVGTFAGQGQDNADKGVWKAVTGAIKYILTSTFLIPTGDDPEADEPKASTKYVQPVATKAVIKTTEPVEVGDWRETIVHFGKNKGKKLGEVEPSWVAWANEKWLLKDGASTQDVSLRNALNEYAKEITQ